MISYSVHAVWQGSTAWPWWQDHPLPSFSFLDDSSMANTQSWHSISMFSTSPYRSFSSSSDILVAPEHPHWGQDVVIFFFAIFASLISGRYKLTNILIQRSNECLPLDSGVVGASLAIRCVTAVVNKRTGTAAGRAFFRRCVRLHCVTTFIAFPTGHGNLLLKKCTHFTVTV